MSTFKRTECHESWVEAGGGSQVKWYKSLLHKFSLLPKSYKSCTFICPQQPSCGLGHSHPASGHRAGQHGPGSHPAAPREDAGGGVHQLGQGLERDQIWSGPGGGRGEGGTDQTLSDVPDHRAGHTRQAESQAHQPGQLGVGRGGHVQSGQNDELCRDGRDRQALGRESSQSHRGAGGPELQSTGPGVGWRVAGGLSLKEEGGAARQPSVHQQNKIFVTKTDFVLFPLNNDTFRDLKLCIFF